MKNFVSSSWFPAKIVEQLISCQKCQPIDFRAIKFQAVDTHSLGLLGIEYKIARVIGFLANSEQGWPLFPCVITFLLTQKQFFV